MKITPWELFPDLELDPYRVRAFIYASAQCQVKNEEKERKRMEARARRKK